MSTTCRSLYVHVPFCRSLCGYCDFYSQVLDRAAVGPLVDAVLRELDAYAAGRTLCFDTVFIGGGTPTVLPPRELTRLLRGVRAYVAPAAELEFSVEANPATVTDETAAALVAAGVNRISLGAQSFDPVELQILDRMHQPAQVGQTVAACRKFGLQQFNLDLIFGIPGQTLATWLATLRSALALRPQHVSCYGLTYEEGTPLRARRDAGRIEPVDPDVEAEMYEAAIDTLSAAGLAHYEISNFARAGCACRHNLRYWHNEPYLGLGPAAAGFIDEVRYKNVADTAAYVAALDAGRSSWSEHERLLPERRARETAILELRLTTGIDRRQFAERYGTDPGVLFADAIEKHAPTGWLELDDTGLRLTRAGRLVADTVIADFL